MDLGRVGVWWSGRWQVSGEPPQEAAPELEDLGYSALWSSGGLEPGLAPRFERLLQETNRVVVASGIVSIWPSPAADIARAVADLDARHPGRFLLGLGASHAALAPDYERPYTHMVAYLDALDAADPGVAPDRRVLAALGPRMLDLAARRAAGAHPYLVPVEHTARARGILGRGPLLAPEVSVVLEPDPTVARAVARAFLAGYLTLPNYKANLRSLGFGDEDQSGVGSDRLVDAVVAHGSVDAVASRVAEHFDAGADHVCVQVLTPDPGSFPLAQYRELAPALNR